jgi:glutamate formiminotransferase
LVSIYQRGAGLSVARIVEFIPNFSEGRRQDVIEALVNEAESVPGVTLLDHSSDASHNRSVFTMVGSPDGIAEAAFRLSKLASERIDMREHSGEHPRMGATDVMPFVPVKEITIEECVDLSKRVAERIWKELGIPSFLYENSAATPERANLAAVRKGQFEGMPEKLLQDNWAPDYGERRIHPTAGITAIGARQPLVAFNVNLSTPDVKIASEIAKTIRGSSGGFKYCKALGVMLEDRGIAQVSINMVNYEGTPLYRVFEAIRAEARRWGVSIIGSEIIGLTPAKALVDCAEYYLQIEGFDYKKQVLENHLL